MTPSRALLTVVSLLAGLLVSVFNATTAAAENDQPKPLSQTTVITNNIQGSTAGADSKWNTTVRGFIHNSDIVTLQEVGPSGWGDPRRNRWSGREADIIRNGNTIQHFLWQVGGTDRVGPTDASLAQVYYLQTDRNGGTNTGGRVNIAIVTRALPDDFMVVANPNQAGRTALGVRFGTNWYFTFHGLAGTNGGGSGGGPGADSAPMLAAIATDVANYNTAHNTTSYYTVGGDFNLEPEDLTIPTGARILRSHLPTQQGGRELDYFVTNDPTTPPTPAFRQDGAQADHYAVQVGTLRAAAAPPSLKIMVHECGVECDSGIDMLKDFVLMLMKPFLTGGLHTELKRSVEFVGDYTSSGGTPEEGAAGEGIGTDAAQDATAVPKYRPNVVMLQAGTQDLLNGDPSAAPGRLSALIDQIQAADPTVVVMVATLDPVANATNEARVTAYNSAVEQLVAAKVAAGQRVVLADMSAVTTADLNADGLTPNASGQQKMAESFTGALLSAEVMGWITEPVPTSPGGSVCDLYAYYGTPCVGAYSMTRAMYSDYDGALYQVRRSSDGATADIGLLARGGYVNAGEQDSFCANTTCTVTVLYDQSPQINDLTVAPGGGENPNADRAADASALPITIGGDHKAYGLDVTPGTGYRNNNTRGIATGGEPEGMYMVASGTHVNAGCCFDFGNAETDSHDDGNGRMDAVNFGTNCYYRNVAPCSGTGPWVAADLENGLFQGGNGSNPANKGNNSNFVTAMLKNNGQTTYALKGGNAQSGGLSTWWDGGLPNNVQGYVPMQKQGAIILGIGGDNSNASAGSFFEGVMTDGYPSDAADNAVQANIVSADYNGNSGGTPVTSQIAGPAVVHSTGATGAGASGYTSVYTVDARNGHLQETYLPFMGDSWKTQDLSAAGNAGTPPVKPGTTPVAVVHCGYTSVFTVDAANNDLQETYLPAIGDSWTTQDLTAKYHTPPTRVTPTAVVHFAGATGGAAACGYTSVYTIDASNGHLQETYLTQLGQDWASQDLTAQTPAPAAQPGTSPVSIVHDGYTSVFTVGVDHDVWETYLSNIGNTWAAHDLTRLSNGPKTTTTPTAVVHDLYTSVYVAGDPLRHLWELYLPAIGDAWTAQDLTAETHGQPVAPGTAPVALYHTGYTSVFTVGQSSMNLQETYLSNIGNTWATHDLNALGHTPPTTETPAVVVHPDTSGALTWTSVFTINQFDNDLQETYLPAIGDAWTTQDLTAKYLTPPVTVNASPTASWSVVHDGYTSAFTVDPHTGDLTESYLPAMGASWRTNDLHTLAGTPALSRGTLPVTMTHDGYLSVFTIDSNGHLWETYLPALGQSWHSQDLTAETNGPVTAVTPTAVLHDGYVSVYTVADGNNAAHNGDLWETYLPALGQSWHTQDLTTIGRTPSVAPATSPVALYHDGYTSVFTADDNPGDTGNDLQETYLAYMGGPWITQDLTTLAHGPTLATYSSPTALQHSGYASVYTVHQSDGHLIEYYVSAIGDQWQAQDLTAKYQAPAVPTTVNALGHLIPIASSVTATYHSGYASVYTIDDGGHIHETYLQAMSDPWKTQDLTAETNGPTTLAPLSPLVHYDTNGGLTWTSLFSINADKSLQETYLPRIGDNWTTQRLPS